MLRIFLAVLFLQVCLGCLNNYEYKYASDWKRGKIWKTSGSIKPNFQGNLKDWELRMKFKEKLAANIEIWDMIALKETKGKKEIVLKPKFYYENNYNGREISYIVSFKKRLGKNHLECAEFCGIIIGKNKKLCTSGNNPGKYHKSTTTKKPKEIIHGACLNNFKMVSTSEWKYQNYYKTNNVIKPTFTGQITDWEIHIQLNDKLEKIEVWDATPAKDVKHKTSIILKPKHYNKVLRSDAHISYTLWFKKKQGRNHFKCVEFCGTVVATKKKLCTKDPVTTTTTPATSTTTSTTAPTTTTNPTSSTTPAMPTTTATTTSTTPKPTTTTSTTTPIATSTATTTPSTTPTTSTTTIANPTTPTPTTTSTTTTTPTTSTTKATSTSTTTIPSTATTAPKENFCNPKYNYAEVIEKSLLFYEAQRSGKLPADQRVKWRKDSTMNDGSTVGKDLTGGYFDSANHMKFGFPMATTITNLAWGMLEFKNAYKHANQYGYAMKAIKWGTDYFLKCHTSKTTFYGQIGDADLDQGRWGRAEDLRMSRPAYKIDEKNPGSDLAAETAAALAASYLLFAKEGDLMYALDLLVHAKELYDFATNYRGTYIKTIPDASRFYGNKNGIKDELAWASLWLFKATGDDKYKTDFLNEFNSLAVETKPVEYSYEDKWLAVKVLAAEMKITDADYLVELKSLLQQPKKTPKGLFFVKRWSPNRYAANLAFLATVASRISDSSFYSSFARSQIDYMLGDSGHSFVVGFGKNPPVKPHHAGSSCPSTGPCNWENYESPKSNPHVLYGALVGGPDANDRYVDNREDYVRNNVACDMNAGFQSAVAGLLELSLGQQCSNTM